MKQFALLFLSFCMACSLVGQNRETILPADTVNLNIVDTTKVTANQDSVTKKETRAERKAREKAEKERSKYYYKDILKDSARLEIERISRIAWRRSAFVPGWGQYTNGGLWWVKVPVIYGGFVTAYLTFDYWQFYYKEYLSELQFRWENNGEPSDGPLGFTQINEQWLSRQKDNARRYRDITILATVGLYGLNIIEAYTDSMLKNRWNISDDLSFKLSPTLLPTYAGANLGYGIRPATLFTPGLKLTMTIK